MPDPTAILLARLREHCADCGRWRGGCDPGTGAYCEPARWVVELFWDLRRAAVLADRVLVLMGGRL